MWMRIYMNHMKTYVYNIYRKLLNIFKSGRKKIILRYSPMTMWEKSWKFSPTYLFKATLRTHLAIHKKWLYLKPTAKSTGFTQATIQRIWSKDRRWKKAVNHTVPTKKVWTVTSPLLVHTMKNKSSNVTKAPTLNMV